MKIPFNKPFIAGKELSYIARAVTLGNIGGDGFFTKQCSRVLEEQFSIHRVLMTPSCTAALEMGAILAEVGPGDEVIMPSYTFVSTANAFVQRGARPVFVDIRPDTLNLDERLIDEAVTERTKAICPVHYAGVGCEMDLIMDTAKKQKLLVIEDAAQGVNAFYRGQALGSIGHLGTYSFHETKNYICGEGGALCINSASLEDRAEIIRDKGTDRQRFFRGLVDKYRWMDIGSSYVPSEISSAFLFGQLELLGPIADRRRAIFEYYEERLAPLAAKGCFRGPVIPDHCQTNYSMYYLLLPEQNVRDNLIAHLAAAEISSVFHYTPLHSSPMGRTFGYEPGCLPITEDVSSRLLRLPFYHDLTDADQASVVEQIFNFFT